MMKRNHKVFAGIMFFLLMVTLYIFGNSPEHYIKEIRQDYRGILVRKYFSKVNHYVIRTNHGEIDVAMLSGEFEDTIALGDSILKRPDENYCLILKSDGSRKEVSYLYIPESVRSDFRWPGEWKDKWLEGGNSSNRNFLTE